MYVGINPEHEEVKRVFSVVIQGLDETPIPLPSSTDVIDVREGRSLVSGADLPARR